MPSSITTPVVQRDWYQRYYNKAGSDRNDLRNPGTLFQALASEASLVRACCRIEHDPATARVLDVGCGSGGSWYQLLRMGYKAANFVGIDLQMERLSAVSETYRGAATVQGDASRLGLGDATFDLIYESTLFVTIADHLVRASIAAEMLRVCRPGGYLLLVDWRFAKPWDRDYRPLTKREIGKLFGLRRATSLVGAWPGALVPPLGRFLSKRASPLYFLIASLCPLLVGQKAFLLRRL